MKRGKGEGGSGREDLRRRRTEKELSEKNEGDRSERLRSTDLLAFDGWLRRAQGVIPHLLVPVSSDGSNLDAFRGGHDAALTCRRRKKEGCELEAQRGKGERDDETRNSPTKKTLVQISPPV